MIEISQLEFGYDEGGFVLRIPELSIERGKAVAIIGASGIGKTTLLHLLAGIVVPRSGTIEVDGVSLPALGDAGRRDFRITRVGLVFQEFELLGYLTVLDNVLLPYRITGALRLSSSSRARAIESAERAGIADKTHRLATKLSQGEKQRVAVCRALITEPSLLLADEPTGNLDPANRQRVLDMLLEYTREKNATLLVVTHDQDRLERFDRVIDMDDMERLAATAAASGASS